MIEFGLTKMDIRTWVFAQQGKGPYELFHLDGSFGCQVDEVLNSPTYPMYLTWFFPEGDISQALTGSYDILSVIPYEGVDWLRTIGGHICKRDKPTDAWTIVDVEEYFMPDGSRGIPEFPINVNDGDAAEVATTGTWTWRDNAGNTGTGTWQNTTTYSLDKCRFTWNEKETEHHNDSGKDVPYYRIRLYDSLGWIGFNDVLVPGVCIRRKDYLTVNY